MAFFNLSPNEVKHCTARFGHQSTDHVSTAEIFAIETLSDKAVAVDHSQNRGVIVKRLSCRGHQHTIFGT